MALCPICGCKTDELDFVTDKISDSEVKMCSFCQRQIHAFDEGKEPGDGHIRWLSSVADKAVSERSGEVNNYLGALKEKYVSEATMESVVIPEGSSPLSTDTRVANTNRSQAELLERIEALENELKNFKRSIRIKTILEVCIPIILTIILVLIFMTSDLFDSLSQLYGFFVQ